MWRTSASPCSLRLLSQQVVQYRRPKLPFHLTTFASLRHPTAIENEEGTTPAATSVHNPLAHRWAMLTQMLFPDLHHVLRFSLPCHGLHHHHMSRMTAFKIQHLAHIPSIQHYAHIPSIPITSKMNLVSLLKNLFVLGLYASVGVTADAVAEAGM